MSSSICLFAILLFVVAIGFIVAYFIRKHPEKISGFNVEEFDNDIVAATKWVNLLCRVMVIASIITLICGIIAVYLESILMFALSVSVPIYNPQNEKLHRIKTKSCLAENETSPIKLHPTLAL